MSIFNPSTYAYIPLSEWVEKYFKEWLFQQRPLFKKLSVPIDSVLNSLDYFFNLVPLPIVILFFAYMAFKTNGIKFAIFTFCSLIFIDLVDVWEETMTTMAMISRQYYFVLRLVFPLVFLLLVVIYLKRFFVLF